MERACEARPVRNASAVDPAAGATPPGIATGYEGSTADQFRADFSRLRAGETGMLPAIGGFIVLCILFEILSPDFLGLLNVEVVDQNEAIGQITAEQQNLAQIKAGNVVRTQI